MKKQTLSVLLTSAFLVCNMSQAQTVRIGNVTNGVTASGNTLSINNGSNAIQIAGVPPILQGVMNATQEAIAPQATAQAPMGNTQAPMGNTQQNSPTNAQPEMDINKANAEKLAQVEAAKNNFLQENQENIKKMANNNNEVPKDTIQREVRVGQDLTTIKPNIVTNDISVYNRITIKQIESKAKDDDKKQYRKFPEYIGKDY